MQLINWCTAQDSSQDVGAGAAAAGLEGFLIRVRSLSDRDWSLIAAAASVAFTTCSPYCPVSVSVFLGGKLDYSNSRRRFFIVSSDIRRGASEMATLMFSFHYTGAHGRVLLFWSVAAVALLFESESWELNLGEAQFKISLQTPLRPVSSTSPPPPFTELINVTDWLVNYFVDTSSHTLLSAAPASCFSQRNAQQKELLFLSHRSYHRNKITRRAEGGGWLSSFISFHNKILIV